MSISLYSESASTCSGVDHVFRHAWGQNCNQQVAALLLYDVQTTSISVIHQKFLESEHPEMEVDSIHSSIERAKKYNPVYTALDWHTIFWNARRNNPNEVVLLTHGDFFDLKRLGNNMLKNI